MSDSEMTRQRLAEVDAVLTEAARILKCHPKQVLDRVRKMTETLEKVEELLAKSNKDQQ